MRKTRTCDSAEMNTGGSACSVDWGKIKGAIIVEHGKKLPAELTPGKLAELCHADRPDRIYPVLTFVEYAKSGGEAQISAVGYGPNQYNGLNAQTDTFTLARFDEMLNAELLRCANKQWDVYYWDSNKMLIGYNDGTGELAGIPMSAVYPGSTPFSTSGAKSSMTVNFAHLDAEDSQLNFDYLKLDFNPGNVVRGLTKVMFVEATSNKYKILELVGGYDRTAEFADALSTNAEHVFTGVTSVSYDNEKGLLTVTPGEGAISIKQPSVLYTKDIKWIEIVKIVKVL